MMVTTRFKWLQRPLFYLNGDLRAYFKCCPDKIQNIRAVLWSELRRNMTVWQQHVIKSQHKYCSTKYYIQPTNFLQFGGWCSECCPSCYGDCNYVWKYICRMFRTWRTWRIICRVKLLSNVQDHLHWAVFQIGSIKVLKINIKCK